MQSALDFKGLLKDIADRKKTHVIKYSTIVQIIYEPPVYGYHRLTISRRGDYPPNGDLVCDLYKAAAALAPKDKPPRIAGPDGVWRDYIHFTQYEITWKDAQPEPILIRRNP